MIHKKIVCYVGDPPEIKDVLKDINYRLNLDEAQQLVRLICRYKRWPIYKVIYTERKTKTVAGTCWIDKKEITIHKTFRNVQTIIHEITHHKTVSHDDLFKKTQLQLIKLFKTKFKQMIFKG